MAPRPTWWHVLQEARRQACVAMDFYNRPGDRCSFLDFVVHMHLAWQSLLHADLMKRKIDIYYRQSNGRFKRGKDGQPRTWELAHCLQNEFKENDPTRANVEFFVGLRNQIEHRFQTALMAVTAAHAHAYVINFERELIDRFGDGQSLAGELRFPLFVQSLTPGGLDEQRKIRRGLPARARTYITKFEAMLDSAVKDDERFVYRVLLTPIKGPKTEADMAYTFVRFDELTEEERLAMVGKEGSVVVAEKIHNYALKDELLPGAAAVAIEARIPFRFGVNDFTRLRQSHEIGPAKGKLGKKTDTKYCVYVKATKQYLYTPAYIDFCVQQIGTAEKYLKAMGRSPRLKVASDVDSAGSAA